MTKLEHLVWREHYLTAIVRDILAHNERTIQDGISKSGRISQKAGVLQGDPLSPLLFSIVTADVTQILEGAANMHMYADNMGLSHVKHIKTTSTGSQNGQVRTTYN